MSRRQSIRIPGFSHANPIPAASRIGDLVVSGALTGRDPATAEMPPDLSAQCANAFHHVRAVMVAAGGTVEDIIKLDVHLVDYRDRDALNREWLAMFPDAQSRPARQVRAAVLDGGALIHVDLMARLASG